MKSLVMELRSQMAAEDHPWHHSRRKDMILPCLVLGLVVVLAYGEVVFLGYTLSPASYCPGVLAEGSYGYEGRRIAQYPMLDAWASGLSEVPMNRLVMQYILSGQLPLWNPYMAAGTPLAADTTISVFAPFRAFDLLPNSYDLIALLRIWLAGVFMFLFLKELRLGNVPALAGAIFYMLSGSFTWYSGMVWISVSVFAPLLVLAVERVIRKASPSAVSLLSLAVFLSILGGFIEVIILQFILAILFFIFRALTLRRLRASLGRFLLGFVAGLGLSSFYLLPIFEYLQRSALGNLPTAGTSHLPYWLFGTFFVPYIVGGPGQYWSNTMSFGQSIVASLPGYTGILALFLSLLALLSWLRFKRDSRLPVPFFMSMALLAVLKTFGNPAVNWIGQLPVLEFVVFYKFLGFFWAFCLATCAAYGIEEILAGAGRGIIIASLAASAGIVLAAFGVLTCFLSDPAVNLPASALPVWIQGLLASNLALYYLVWKAAEACIVLFVGALISDRVSRDRSLAPALLCLIVIEMTWYIPRGMPYSQQMIQSAWMMIAISLLCMLVSLRTTLALRIPRLKLPCCGALRIRAPVLAIFLVAVLIGQVAVSDTSPYGFPHRYDPFREAPYITFLRQNVGSYRVYSIEYTLVSSYAGIYGIQTLGIVSAFNVDTFGAFARSYLDSQKLGTILDSEFMRPWPSGLGNDVVELQKNKRFYDLMGVRYIVARSNLTEILSLPLVYSGEVMIYENPDAYPRAFLATRYMKASSYVQAQSMLARTDIDLRSEVIIEDPGRQVEEPTTISPDTACHCYAEVVRYGPNAVVVEVQTDKSAFLMLTDTYYPGWSAQVDGSGVIVYRADGLFRAVRVEAGHHTVTFNYFPQTFSAGIVTSVVTGLALAGSCLETWLKGRKSRMSCLRSRASCSGNARERLPFTYHPRIPKML